MLAESWDVSGDLTQLKLNLRKGVQFHSGREFTSADVEYNLMRVRNPQLAGIVGGLAPQSNWWTSIDASDPYTVILKSDMPRPGMFDFLELFNILDKDTMEGPDAKTKAVGTGPFRFVEWVQGDHFTFTRNPNYWQSGHPYLDGITVKILSDAQTQIAALEAGAGPIWRIVRRSATPADSSKIRTTDIWARILAVSISASLSIPACRLSTISSCAKRSTMPSIGNVSQTVSCWDWSDRARIYPGRRRPVRVNPTKTTCTPLISTKLNRCWQVPREQPSVRHSLP